MRNLLFAIPGIALGMYLVPVGRPATLEEKLEFAAGYLNQHWAEELGPEFGKVRVEAEVIDKDTLVLRMLDTPTGYETADPNYLRKILRRDACKVRSVRDIFDRGGKMRAEIVSNIGIEVATFQLARC